MVDVNLTDKNILLGVCGGIAAYKSPMIVRALRAAGAEVQVVLSANAHRFVTATTLQAVSGNPVRQDPWDESAEAAMGHIELARWADLVLIAPATANTMARLAHGFADDLLTTIGLATAAPVYLAPAMNQQMYQHTATQNNLGMLARLGYYFIGPESGDQACGETGPGRMTEPDDLVASIAGHFEQSTHDDATKPLAGRTVMITTGPTVEAIDPVRYISNHSSGKQGLGLAEAAQNAGARVILIAGPTVPAAISGIRRIDVVSAREMEQAVHDNFDEADVFIGVAAVADYRPAEAHDQKIKRAGSENAGMQIDLVENPDIIAGVAKRAAGRPPASKPIVIGFAAETNNTLEHARAKRKRKCLDAIVLNDVSDPSIGFNSDDNAATLIHEQGEMVFERQPKKQLADALIQEIAKIFALQLADTNPATVTK